MAIKPDIQLVVGANISPLISDLDKGFSIAEKKAAATAVEMERSFVRVTQLGEELAKFIIKEFSLPQSFLNFREFQESTDKLEELQQRFEDLRQETTGIIPARADATDILLLDEIEEELAQLERKVEADRQFMQQSAEAIPTADASPGALLAASAAIEAQTKIASFLLDIEKLQGSLNLLDDSLERIRERNLSPDSLLRKEFVDEGALLTSGELNPEVLNELIQLFRGFITQIQETGFPVQLMNVQELADVLLLAIRESKEDFGVAPGAEGEGAVGLGGTNEQLQELCNSLTDVSAKINQTTDGFVATGEAGTEAYSNVDAAAQQAAATIVGSLKQAILTGQSFEDTLKNIGNALLNLVLDAALAPLQEALGSFFSGLFSPKAKGDVFSGGNVVPFARGGIVSAPTLFPMARGGIGLMGEAGPEAIMPLRRGRGGRLGVEGAGQVNVNIFNNSGAEVRTRRRQTGRGTDIEVMIDQAVARNISRGGATAQAIQTAFGARPVVGTR